MKKYKITQQGYKVKDTHFSLSTFLAILGGFFLISGIHTGLIRGVNNLDINGTIQTGIIILYWIMISILLTFFTRWQIKRSYEMPMKLLAEATAKVANGDFSVFVSPLHTVEKLDYLDVMIIDFNKMVEELGSIETLKTDFFSNVSHEIKTPLAVMLNTAELLQKSELNEKQQEAVMMIIQSGRKLSTLITNILKINKLEKQNIQPVMEKYDLCEQLCECALQFERAWEKKQLEFDVEIEDKANIEADASLLELVWTNLLSNAVKFTASGGKILLKQLSTENEVIVSVSDNGCGMSKETIQHIFDKFYQGDTSHSMEGNGLGLALCFRIVQMLDGEIMVNSEVGKGSCFTVRLPIAYKLK